MIKLVKVHKYFNRRKRNQIHIINNANLEIENTGLVAILGPSGSGKTTLLNAIGGLDKVNKGKIYINGKKITHRRMGRVDKIRNINISYIFQDYKLLENLSVFENVALSLKMIGVKNKKEIEKRVNYVLEAVNMYRYRNRPAKMLSGGEKQRVSIARAIVKNPNIIIADEPTGNLDSKNSIEVMNIIKSISKNKLVILVTHEVDLAEFYATRIIEIKDGKIEKDYKNEIKESLEYRLDNKIYLKDIKNKQNIKSENVNIDIYTEENSNDISVNLVVKNGNVYIESSNNKIEVIDDYSAVELVDSHYKKLKKNIYEEDSFNIENVIEKHYRIKYKSIYGIIKSIIAGFKKITNYTILRKIFLLGFFISSMFIVYAVCNIAGTMELRDADFINVNKNYLEIPSTKLTVEDYLQYEQLEDVSYILPGDSNVSFKIKADDFYQTSRFTFEIKGSLMCLDYLNQSKLYKGRMPQNEYEIVLDKMILDDLLNNGQITSGMGFKNEEELLGKNLQIDDMNDFYIVGLVDNESPSIYMDKNIFINLLNNSVKSDFGIGIYIQDSEEEKFSNKVMDYNLYLDDIELVKGRLPENDYEVIVNISNKEQMKINKPINVKVNGEELTVVGYYDSPENMQNYLVNNETVKYDLINKSNGFMIYTENKNALLDKLHKEYNINAVDKYERDKEMYLAERAESRKSSFILAGIILAISIIEIYLMIRSSFLSRIREIGILRAIGIKKSDIYRMFIGEIIAILICSSMPGIALMTYILSSVTKISYYSRTFIVSIQTIGISIAIITIFNIIVGLLPLYRVIRRRPAQILSRHDVE